MSEYNIHKFSSDNKSEAVNDLETKNLQKSLPIRFDGTWDMCRVSYFHDSITLISTYAIIITLITRCTCSQTANSTKTAALFRSVAAQLERSVVAPSVE